MADPRIGVIGIPGKWSTEVLADAVEQRTGFRLVIDMGRVELDLSQNRLLFQGHDLCQLDGLLVKKISAEYSPNTIDRLELLRVAERRGVRVFSGAENMLRLVDRLSCTITLRNAGIPMPETRATEDIEAAIELSTGTPADPFRIDRAKQRIEDLYHDRGHQFVTVQMERSDTADGL